MSELTRELRKRVEGKLAVLGPYLGSDSAAVRLALEILTEAEQIDRDIAEQWVTTERAVEVTRWNRDTLLKYARASLANELLPQAWTGLAARQSPSGWVFRLGTIPLKVAA